MSPYLHFKIIPLVFGLFLFHGHAVEAQESFRDQLRQYDRDDIHSIHKRLFTKKGRHEFTSNLGGIFNNNGYFLSTAQYQYHFFESFGFEAAAGGYGFQVGGEDQLGFYQGSLSFSPIYGKISWFTWAVLNFDLYAVGGAGAVAYSIRGVDGTSFMGNVGLGARVFINEFLSFKLEFRDYFYERTFPGEPDSVLHNYALTGGLSVLIPFRQSY